MFICQPSAVLAEVKNHSCEAEGSCLSIAPYVPAKQRVSAVIAEGTLPLSSQILT